MSRFVKSSQFNTLKDARTGGLGLPGGTTAERDPAPLPGELRWNTSISRLEYYNGSGYTEVSGRGNVTITKDAFTGDGTTVAYVLSITPTDANNILVFVSNVYQEPITNYTLTGATLTFTSPPPSAATIVVLHGFDSTGNTTPPPVGNNTVIVKDEGTTVLAAASGLNFIGSGVAVTDAGGGQANVTITGGGGGSALNVQDEGSTLSAAVTKINFAGAGVTATQPVANEILVTIPAGTPGPAGENAIIKLNSTSTETLGVGSRTFTYPTQANLGWFPGLRLRAYAGPVNVMDGLITSVSSTSVTFIADAVVGTGTFSSWVLGIAGEQGIPGTNGTNGASADMTRSSTTSVLIGTGSKSFTYSSSSNLGWTVGTRLRAFFNSSNYMEGVVTAVSSTSVTITSDYIVGSGTRASWALTIAGDLGTTSDIVRASTDSISIAAGSKTLNYSVASLNIGWAIGTRLRFYFDASNYMEGDVTAVSNTSVTINATTVVGSGTQASWTISIAGNIGSTGASWPAFTVVNTPSAATLGNSDFGGNVLRRCNSVSNFNLTLNTGLTGLEPLLIYQENTGQITITGTATLRNRNGLKTAGQQALITIVPLGSDVYVVGGDCTV